MKRLLRITLPIAVLSVCIWVAWQIFSAQPEAARRPPPPSITEVDVLRLQPQSYQVTIHSQGTVQPRTESTLIPELNGRIITMAANFAEGAFFERGDVLVQLDPRDYEIAVTVAEAELARSQATLAEEQARAQVAERDWQKLNRGKNANQLVLRKPQVAAARAAVKAAEAQLARARLNLERTRITAPYAGRVLEKNVGEGQYVGTGTVLAKIYAIDYVEIRLPLSQQQLTYLDLPEQYRGEPRRTNGTEVILTGRNQQRWQGQIVRAEGALDAQSRQLFVVARIDDPYRRRSNTSAAIRIGQFVQAQIAGEVINNVFVIPRSTLREGDQVLLVDNNNTLAQRAVNVIWRDNDNVVIDRGLEIDERLVTTPLSIAAQGAPVRVRSEAPKHDTPRATQTAPALPSVPNSG